MDYTTMDDETLIRLIAHAHAEALSELYDRYSRLVFSLALNSVGDQATAEEITQDVFVRVWQRAGQYRAARGKVSTWLTGIIRYRAIDQLRQQGSRPEQHSVAWAEVSPTAVTAVNGPEEATHLAMQRERVRAALAQLPVAEPRPSSWQQLVGLFGRAAPAWGAVALIPVVVLAASNLWLWQRLNGVSTVTTTGGMQVIALADTEVAPDAAGTLVISDDGEYGTLIVDGLPDLDEDQQYQLWLIRDGQRTSGGVFSVNAEGYEALWISSPEPHSSYPAFGITIEPAGGSPGPTGEKVLGGNL